MTPEQMIKANEALNKAKIKLMSKPDSAFFITLCFSMKHVWDETLPTAACDGKKVYWNPDFFMSLADADERVFLMLHETMHAAYLHMDPVRVAGRDKKKWNIAADHVINLQLIARGFKMPTGVNKGHADIQYAGMSTEEVYKLLPDGGEPKMDDLMGPPKDPAKMEELRLSIEDALIRARIQSKVAGDKPGTIPGDIELFLDKLLNPKLPWFRILAKYLQSFAKIDYTWKLPNRRFFPQYHLPSLWGSSLIDLVAAVDISCSVSDEDFLRIVTELASIFRMMKPKKITIIQFDTNIKSIDVVTSVSELLKVKFTGRGGTDITPVIDWAIANKPQLLLVFSDGEFYWPGQQTKSPTLWLIHENPSFSPPFGKTIHYEM